MASIADASGRGGAAGCEGVSRVCAIITARNEEIYAKSLFPYLVANGVDFYLIDHGSTDRTKEIAKDFENRGLVGIKDLPFDGTFNLTQMLKAEAQAVQSLPHEWILHHDMDEILQHPDPDRTLASDADSDGTNVVNFNEFVFLPPTAGPENEAAYRQHNLDYYFFEPHQNRLMRLWRRGCGLSNIHSGGHRLEGDVRQFARMGQMRHYITLSQEHIWKKYLNRIFSSEDVNKGWHGNRIDLAREMLDISLVPPDNLYRSVSPDDRDLKTDRPFQKHFWEW